MEPTLRFKEFINDWNTCNLNDICTGFDYGIGASATDYDGKHKYIRITDIDENSHEYIGNPIVSPDCIPDTKYIVNDNDILFARTGASTGKTYLFNKKDHPLYFAGFLIRFNVYKANPSFVFYQTLTKDYNNWIKLTSTRSGQPGINAEELKNYSFKCPKIEEQNKIATFLNLYYKKIELQKKKIEELNNLFKFFLHYEFNKITNLKPLGSFAQIYQPQTITQSDFIKNGKYKVFGANGYIGFYNKYNHEFEQVVISCRGEKSSQVNLVEPYSWITGNSMVINLDQNNSIDKFYLYYALKSQNLKYLITGSGQPQIVRSDLINHQLPFADLKTQKLIVTKLKNINKKILLEQQKLELLERYKQGLLQKMFI